MESLIILIPLSLVAVLCAVWFFFRMSNSGQFDDNQGPAWSVLLDDDRALATDNTSNEQDEDRSNTARVDVDQEVTEKDLYSVPGINMNKRRKN